MPNRTPLSVSRRMTAMLACVLVITVGAAYARTLAVPFHFDDFEAILHNATIRHLWPLTDVLAPPHHLGSTVGGRPLLNLTFALNYAISGEAPWSYHAINLLIHTANTLLLFGICRRTLVIASAWRSPCASPVVPLATPASANTAPASLAGFAIASLWALHPLQTEAVTYISQRAESLASSFYLLTVYAFLRSAPVHVADNDSREIERRRHSTATSLWLGVSAIACLLGVTTKEIVATAPIIVLLFDRTFLCGSFWSAWRARRPYYVALASSWIVVAALVISTQNRGGTAGFGTGVSVWAYLLTQSQAIAHYLRLTLWPKGLVFDYGTAHVSEVLEVWPYGLLVIALLGTSIALFVRSDREPAKRGIGFLGLAFFILLAPSSSIVPVSSQTVAEHRMYLPLAAVAALVGVAAWRWLGRRSVPLLVFLAFAEGLACFARNEVYRSDLTLWSDTVAHAPQNARAHNNLGDALVTRRRFAEALPHYQTAVQLEPDYVDAQSNLAHVLVMLGRATEAVPHAEMAVRTHPDAPEVWTNYGLALAHTDRLRDAIAAFERALQLSPTAVDARYDLGNVYYQLREYTTAIAQYEQALQVQPGRHDARFNLAYALLRLNRPEDALAQFETLLQQDPNDAGAHIEVGNILAHFGRIADATAHFQAALQLQPDNATARELLAQIKAQAPR